MSHHICITTNVHGEHMPEATRKEKVIWFFPPATCAVERRKMWKELGESRDVLGIFGATFQCYCFI